MKINKTLWFFPEVHIFCWLQAEIVCSFAYPNTQFFTLPCQNHVWVKSDWMSMCCQTFVWKQVCLGWWYILLKCCFLDSSHSHWRYEMPRFQILSQYIFPNWRCQQESLMTAWQLMQFSGHQYCGFKFCQRRSFSRRLISWLYILPCTYWVNRWRKDGFFLPENVVHTLLFFSNKSYTSSQTLF